VAFGGGFARLVAVAGGHRLARQPADGEMKMKRLVGLELKNFLAGRAVLLGLAVIFLAGLYAIEHGRRLIAAQQRVLAATPEMQREHLEKMLAQHAAPDGPGNALYYINFFTMHEPSRFAPLSVGLRDVNPFNLKVRMLTLEGQLYDSEISNPATLALGNFDLSFLLIFLYPLLIIAFTHNTLSAEQEQGTWNLICSQPASPRKVFALKALIRFSAILGVWLLTLLIVTVWLRLPLEHRIAFVLLVSVSYLFFWFAASLLVMSFCRSSNFNALALLGVWLCLTILVPAALNVALSGLLPVPEALEVTVRQREGYHQQWDRPKAETMQRFFARYPEYSSFQAPPDRFSWGWYYAAQHLGDEDAAFSSAQFREKLAQRQRWTERLAWLTPTINAQLSLNRIAQTDLANHLAYLDSVRDFHEQVRRFVYPHLLCNGPAPAVDWGRLPRHQFQDEAHPIPASALSLSLLSLLTMSALLALLAAKRFARQVP
jgi:ABC-2 type transport system permease protein